MSEQTKEELVEQETAQEETTSETTEETVSKEESLEEKIARLEEELKQSEEKYLRVHADFENIKKRHEREKYQAIDYASELLRKLKEGIELTIKNFNTTFEKHNITKVETDGEFDPNVHNAVMQVDSENHESGQIVAELQKGYMLKDRLLRPSMVSIAN